MNQTIIQTQNLRKVYGMGDIQVNALDGVDLRIEQGEFVAVMGPSGSGKSTLMNILGCLDRATSGQYILDGEDMSDLDKPQLAVIRNRKIGFIFQFHQLLPEFTALENVSIPALIGKMPRKQAEDRARELLDFLGLSDRLNHKPNALSGGEQQRVAVARALMNRPAVLLADEPSGNLDSESAAKLHALFFKLRDELGQTIILVTHNKELADMADRKLTMVDGQIIPI